MEQPVIHLIGNAHLDPVWLWDRYEGLNEGLATVRALLNLMDTYPEMTFIRGEASIYEQVRQWDPQSFERIRKMVTAGRWDVVGGNWVQPDTNIPGTEALCRQYDLGMKYVESHFGMRPTCAWAADSFGHGAGFPEIYHEAGFTDFVFSRPLEEQLPLESSLFWWEGPGGNRILTYRLESQWYGMERDEIPRRFDKVLKVARNSPLGMAALFYGLGNHGGGPSARHLEEIREWCSAHPDVRVVHSGLHRLMKDFRERMQRRAWEPPVHRGELNFCLRGCYASSMATKIAYRKAEAATRRAEASQAAALLAAAEPVKSVRLDWNNLCFNAFHDILPGTSIAAATEMQLEAMARLADEARDAEYNSLLAVSRNWVHPDFSAELPYDHPLPQPVLLFNPHPWTVRDIVEVEAPLDYRLQLSQPDSYSTIPVRVFDTDGNDLPFQRLTPRNRFLSQYPWRLNAAVEVTVPAMGFSMIYVGLWPDCAKSEHPSTSPSTQGQIANGAFEVHAAADTESVELLANGRSIFGNAGGLRLRTVADTFGSWGGHYDEPGSDDLQETLEEWRILAARVTESGPLLSRLWVRMAGETERSQIDLEFTLRKGSPMVQIKGDLVWNEPGARLKLEFPAGDTARYEVPGGSIQRGELGEVPGGRWVRVKTGGNSRELVFASTGLTNFNLGHGRFQCTLARSTPYAADKGYDPEKEPWRPIHDRGRLTFTAVIAKTEAPPHTLAAQTENPVGWLNVPNMNGTHTSDSPLFTAEPNTVELLGVRPAETESNRLDLRLLNHGETCRPTLLVRGKRIELDELPTGHIRSFQVDVLQPLNTAPGP
jgi:alpha-mannosidase